MKRFTWYCLSTQLALGCYTAFVHAESDSSQWATTWSQAENDPSPDTGFISKGGFTNSKLLFTRSESRRMYKDFPEYNNLRGTCENWLNEAYHDFVFKKSPDIETQCQRVTFKARVTTSSLYSYNKSGSTTSYSGEIMTVAYQIYCEERDPRSDGGRQMFLECKNRLDQNCVTDPVYSTIKKSPTLFQESEPTSAAACAVVEKK